MNTLGYSRPGKSNDRFHYYEQTLLSGLQIYNSGEQLLAEISPGRMGFIPFRCGKFPQFIYKSSSAFIYIYTFSIHLYLFRLSP